jgi:hypothetical protein
LLLEAKLTTQQSLWKSENVTPEMKIGETIPWKYMGPWEEVTLNGITQILPGNPEAKYWKESNKSPVTCDIEHKISKTFEEEIPLSEEIFDSLMSIILSIRENPQGKWIKWSPILVDFLINNINLQDPSGEIRMSDLLSTFKRLKSECDMYRHLLRISFIENERLRTKLKMTRRNLFRSNKFK